VVVTSAGNLGRSDSGQPQRGGITAPGNAPWVLTVGATNHQRTVSRGDDVVAPFSSRGPTNIDHAMKPDIVAPGVGIESLAAAGSTLYAANPASRLAGTVDTASMPYLSMTGTSMAAPVVAGTIALMLEANPELTPNLVKAILQYTAERRARVDLAAQGAGFLNARGAVQLAQALRDATTTTEPDPVAWSRHIIWGNERVRGGVLTADASAWRSDVIWGAAETPDGERVSWGKAANGDGTWGAGGDAEAIEIEDLDDVAFFNPLTESDPALWEPGAMPAPWTARAIAAILPVERRWLGVPADITEMRGY
jgi:subtilisin family serine protease